MNKSIGKLLREARLKKGLKQIEVAQKAGISQPYYNLIENDKSRPPSFYAIEKIAYILGCDSKPLIKILEYKQLEYKTKEIEQRKQALGIKEDRQPYGKFRQIPVLNKISASKLIDYTGLEYPASWAEEYEPCPSEVKDSQAFCLDVQGDSMEPKISAGDRVIISPNAQLENGQIALVTNDEETTLKRVHFRENGTIILTSDNPKYQPITWIKKDKSKIIGKVVRIIKRL